ncbi:MAG: endonuclease/exonuclease/phosphatase family protein [Porphyromonas sp.]|nr:endonuclease/exonuclease/phosphatase family protein [Porphyromonas sp.]
MKKRFYIYILATLVISGLLLSCGKKRSSDSQESAIPEEDKVVTIMSYNVLRFVYDKENPYNYETIAKLVHEKGAEAVALNELDKLTTRSREEDQLAHFAQVLGGWDFEFGSAMPYMGGDYGEGIATRESAVQKFSVQLPKGVGAEPRVMVVMELEDYVIATTHLDHVSDEAQIGQVEKITEEIAKLYKDSDKPVFLAGDLNATPDSETIAILEKDWIRLSGTEPTFPSHAPRGCIDYVYQYNNGVECEVLHSEVVTTAEAGDMTVMSDHLPVLVKVKILSK